MPTYLGIDFGTSNSHVAYCHDPGEGPLTALPIRLGGATSVATCVLWHCPPGAPPAVVAFGTVAVETWSQFEPQDRAQHRIAYGFKPDIGRSARARADAVAFLGKLQEASVAVQPAAVRDGLVVIGVPAEIDQEHRDQTGEIAREAGFGKAICVDEPLGALAYHLNNGSISPAEARGGVVVVDFGGGTMDLALVDAEQGLRAPWGDPVLGGRLFDDLFYQWIQDQNGAFEVDEREAMAVWQKECRELKESFSRRWSMLGDGMADFRYRIDVGESRKTLRNASVAEFIARARGYRPSALALRYFQEFGLPAPLASGRPIDLLDWIRRTLEHEGQDEAVRGETMQGRFSKVILTGGSSEWPFMRDLAARAFGVDPRSGILRSDDPEATVGAGLALYNALRARHQARRAGIAAAAPPAREEFAAAVSVRLDRFADDVAQATVAAIMPRIEEVFRTWYHQGGTLTAVEQETTRICTEFEPEAVRLVETTWRMLDTDLLRFLRDHLLDFLQTHEIRRDVARYIPDSITAVSLIGVGGSAGDRIAAELGGFAADMATFAAGIGTFIIAAIHLHVVVLLAIAHPVLAVVAGLGTLAAWLGFSTAVGSAIESTVRNHDFNLASRSILHIAMSESAFIRKLAEGRAAAQRELSHKIMEGLEGRGEGKDGIVKAAAAAFDAVVAQAIADLGVLEQLAPGGAPRMAELAPG
ncbi:protein of unknown function [Rhodovastum atsumiense]|nr:Hsp70 family protein [Rhodovastum atsumiense]CAH2598635.1 protein of unknown function [Rhodovastum atsumiense]